MLRICIASGSGFLLASGALLTVQFLLESGYFGVEQIGVEQQVRVSEGDILDASDIKVGDSLFDLELHMIGRKIEEHAWIESAEVERSFPNRVVIRVKEREARAIIDLGYLYYVDRNGEVFKMLDANDELNYPVITGIDRQYLLDNPDKTEGCVKLALRLMDELDKREIFNLQEVSEIHYDQQDGLVLHTRVGGVPVRMGEESFDTKLNRLEHIYEDIEPRLLALKYIDLNVTDRVIVKVDVKRTNGRS
jgi:cell division protein FtsQ